MYDLAHILTIILMYDMLKSEQSFYVNCTLMWSKVGSMTSGLCTTLSQAAPSLYRTSLHGSVCIKCLVLACFFLMTTPYIGSGCRLCHTLCMYNAH